MSGFAAAGLDTAVEPSGPEFSGAEFTVVGGGVAGLVVARRLALAGRTVTLLEASDRLGGVVSRHVVGGVEQDAGAESFALRGGIVADLLTELGLAESIVAPEPVSAWLLRADGSAVPLPATAVLGIPGDPLADDVVAVIGRRAARRARMDALLPAPRTAPTGSLGDLVRRRMGAGVLDGLVAPVVHGVHSLHPDDIALDRAAPGLGAALVTHGSLAAAVRAMKKAAPAGSSVGGIDGGMNRLVSALAADLQLAGVTVELGRRVDDLSTLPGTVVVAAPGLLPTTSDSAAGVVEAPELLGTGRVIRLVTLVLDAPVLDADPRGSGLLVAAGAPVRARALTHGTAKWGWLRERLAGRHVVRLSYDEAFTDDPIETARQDAATMLGVELPASAVLDSAVVEWVRPAPVAVPEGVVVVGEQVAGSGLANVIRQAEQTATALLTA